MQKLTTLAQIEDWRSGYEMALVYIGSEGCGVCRDLLGKLEKIVEKYPDVHMAKTYVDELPALAAVYQVFSVPLILLYIQQKETIREAGIISLVALEQKIARYVDLLYGE